MKPCRECRHEISEQALSCPQCGAPFPAKDKWDGWGYEYKSKITLFDLPLIHISFKYRPNRVPVPAKGIIAIGQFGYGVITIAQFGIGLFSLCQLPLQDSQSLSLQWLILSLPSSDFISTKDAASW